jgi:hypothetical protein
VGRDSNSGTAPEGRRGGQIPSPFEFAAKPELGLDVGRDTFWLTGGWVGSQFLDRCVTHELGDPTRAEELGRWRPDPGDEEMEQHMDPASDPSFEDDEDQ